MRIDIKDLLDSVSALRSPGARIGFPDDPTQVDIADPQELTGCLNSALTAFRELRGGADYLANAEVNTFHRQVWVRFVQHGPSQPATGRLSRRFTHRFKPFVQS